MSVVEKGGSSVIHSSHRTGCPDLRLLHYNDVYHVEYVPRSMLPIYPYKQISRILKLTLQIRLCRTSRWRLSFPIRRQLLPV